MHRIFAIASIAASICTVTPSVAQHSQMGGMSMPGMQGMQGMKNMGPAHRELMQAMDQMIKELMQEMVNPDPGMVWMKSIPAHHREAASGGYRKGRAARFWTTDERRKR